MMRNVALAERVQPELFSVAMLTKSNGCVPIARIGCMENYQSQVYPSQKT